MLLDDHRLKLEGLGKKKKLLIAVIFQETATLV